MSKYTNRISEMGPVLGDIAVVCRGLSLTTLLAYIALSNKIAGCKNL